jgi:hypothetical protein
MYINFIYINICLYIDGYFYAILSVVFPGERIFGEARWEYCDIDPDLKKHGIWGSKWIDLARDKSNTNGKRMRIEILKHRILFSELWLSSLFGYTVQLYEGGTKNKRNYFFKIVY